MFANRGHPQWPKSVDVIYGWRGFIQPLQLRANPPAGIAEYTVTNEMLYDMNLLDPPFYVKDEVVIRVKFSEDIIVDSMPFRIGVSQIPIRKSAGESVHGVVEEGYASESKVQFVNQNQENQENWAQTMAHAWQGSNASSHGDRESDFEEEVMPIFSVCIN